MKLVKEGNQVVDYSLFEQCWVLLLGWLRESVDEVEYQ